MYLAIMLIVVAILVFYNEYNSKMDISEYILLAIAVIVIIRASMNYIQIDNTIIEGFTTNKDTTKDKFKNRKVEYNNNVYNKDKDDTDTEDTEDTMILNSEESNDYLDSEDLTTDDLTSKINQNKNMNSFENSISIDNARNENKKSTSAVNQINDLLGISSNFVDIPTPTNGSNDSEIKSVFNPKVIIGKGNSNSNDNSNDNSNSSSRWNSAFDYDGFKFNNTMKPDKNLWRDEHSYYNGGNSNSNSDGNSDCDGGNYKHKGISGNDWSQNMDDYNKGKWKRNLYSRPSDYVDYTNPDSYGTNTPDSSSQNQDTSQEPSPNGETKKYCGQYTNLDEDQTGELIVKDYKNSKKWVAGYTYVPPVHWDVPQRHTPVCNSANPNVQKLTGIMDRGLPINALELNQDGRIAHTENSVKLSNVGSMVSKFNYQEQPFSKPYV